MLKTFKSFGILLTIALASMTQSAQAAVCEKPLDVVLNTLNCVSKGVEDAVCAGAGYAADFKKLHNRVDTNTVISGPEFWAGAFAILDLTLDVNHAVQVGPDLVEVRYVETVEVGGLKDFGFVYKTIYQHEHALVTVNGDCKMTLWDQYGDNKEQSDVDVAVAEFIEIISNPAPAAK